jgi:hypothetical protein
MERVDFSSSTLLQVRDGNTISNGKWLRRGLPKLVENLKIPDSKKIELVSYIKTNGDVCMFSYVETPDGGRFLVATRNSSIFVENQEDLEDIDDKFF